MIIRLTPIATIGLMCIVLCETPIARCSEPVAAPARRLALLIGVGRYQHLPASEHLDGCANDVVAMRQVLQSRFGFAPADVVTLVDEQATGPAIRTAMKHLAEQVGGLPAGTSTQVVFHFSGHGSQVTDQPEGNPDCDEDDGLDETMVPYDALAQGGDQDLRDDELNAFADTVCKNKSARLCIVLDCCHSGSGARGTTKLRRLTRGLRNLPDDAPPGRRIQPKPLPDGSVMLSACRAKEVEPEYQEGDKTYGLLTRFVVQSLTQSRTVSALNYEQLRRSVLHGYQTTAGVAQAPMPQLEGAPGDLRAAVLGAGAANDLPPYYAVEQVPNDPSRAQLAAGTFHGITVGSLFEVVDAGSVDGSAPSATSAPADDGLLLKIVQVDGASARGKLQRGCGDSASAARWPKQLAAAVALERYHDLGDAGLRVAVVRAVNDRTDGARLRKDATDLQVVLDGFALAQRRSESPWLTWVEGEGSVDVVLKISGKQAAIFPATGRTLREPGAGTSQPAGLPDADPLRGGWGPIDLDQVKGAEQLADHLRRISRARNLIRLASSQSEQQGKSAANSAVELTLAHVGVDAQQAIVDEGDWMPDKESSLIMKEGEFYALRVTNPATTKDPLYATVLIIGPNLDIQIAFPRQSGAGLVDEQALLPNQPRLSDGFACDDLKGERWAIVLATSKPHDLTYVAQDELPRVRGGADAFQRLLQEQTITRTRGDHRLGGAVAPAERWSAAVIRWEARP